MSSLYQIQELIAQLKTLLRAETQALKDGQSAALEQYWAEKTQLTAAFEKTVHQYKKKQGRFNTLSPQDRQQLDAEIFSLSALLKTNMRFLAYQIKVKKIIITGLTTGAGEADHPLNNYTPSGSAQGSKMHKPSVSLNEHL